jgi:hypothetical protein
MGFHKRYINKVCILENIFELDRLFKADALIMDMWSTRFTNDLNREERNLREKIKEDQKLLSGCPDKHPDYNKLNSLSEALIGLMTNPTWLDIHFTKTKLGLQFSFEDGGIFEVQKNKCIKAIIEHYESES